MRFRAVRYLVALSLLFAASCSPGNDNAADNNFVDIDLAANEAQGSIDAYANTTEESAPATPAPEPAPGAISKPPPLTPTAPAEAGGRPDDRRPVSEGPFIPDSAQGAASIVRTDYALLREGKYRRAWALWETRPIPNSGSVL
jgi:hypothetical protein